MAIHVVHLTSAHLPFDTRIFHKQCKSLAMAGYDVTLIAPYAGGDLLRDGVKLRAVCPGRNRRERIMRTVADVYRAAVEEDAQLYQFHDPELMPVGFLLRMRGKHVIFDVHEDFPGTLRGKKWLPLVLRGPAAFAVWLCERLTAIVCSHIITATGHIAQKFPAQKTCVIENLPWTNELRSAEGTPYGQREPIIVYVGALSDARGLREMKEVTRIVARQTPVKLLVGGKIFSGAEADSFDEADKLVEYLGFLERPQVAELLGRARVGLVLHHSLGNYLTGQPTKLYEYMSAGLPVIASNFPVCRRIVEPAGCGLLVDPLDTKAIAEALIWLLRHPEEAAEMGRRGQHAVAEKYNWELESEKLLRTYRELLPNARDLIVRENVVNHDAKIV